MYANILVPLDGSSFSEHAIPYATAVARRSGARLSVVLVHAPTAAQMAELAPTPMFEDWESRLRQREATYLDELVGRIGGAGLDVAAERLEGDVAHELIERSKSDADLLVLATHGRAGLERAWLGSVADEVLHHVELPVLLVRPSGEGPPPSEVQFQHILAATDGSPAADAAVDQAVGLARGFDARLTLLRVVAVPFGLSSPYLPHAASLDREVTEERKAAARAFLDERVAELGDGLEVKGEAVAAYHAARGILGAVDRLGCDLVAVGTHRDQRLARIFLGSVADKVVRAAPVPVLIAHAEA
jgi:nucleotide-binding universal stress UspA family protein